MISRIQVVLHSVVTQIKNNLSHMMRFQREVKVQRDDWEIQCNCWFSYSREFRFYSYEVLFIFRHERGSYTEIRNLVLTLHETWKYWIIIFKLTAKYSLNNRYLEALLKIIYFYFCWYEMLRELINKIYHFNSCRVSSTNRYIFGFRFIIFPSA